MSFSDLFDSEFKNRNKGHFSAIVRVALADGIVVAEEQLFLDKLATKLEISDLEYAEILENPTKFAINPPYLLEHKLERLYDLTRMVHVDHHLGDKQEMLLHKFGIALGFDDHTIEDTIRKALEMVDQKADLDTFSAAFSKH